MHTTVDTTRIERPIKKESRRVKQAKLVEHIKVIIPWLQSTFYVGGESSMSKEEVFHMYISHCEEAALDPLSSGIFGKVFHKAFPTIKGARKGPRGQAKHHYQPLGLRAHVSTLKPLAPVYIAVDSGSAAAMVNVKELPTSELSSPPSSERRYGYRGPAISPQYVHPAEVMAIPAMTATLSHMQQHVAAVHASQAQQSFTEMLHHGLVQPQQQLHHHQPQQQQKQHAAPLYTPQEPAYNYSSPPLAAVKSEPSTWSFVDTAPAYYFPEQPKLQQPQHQQQRLYQQLPAQVQSQPQPDPTVGINRGDIDPAIAQTMPTEEYARMAYDFIVFYNRYQNALVRSIHFTPNIVDNMREMRACIQTFYQETSLWVRSLLHPNHVVLTNAFLRATLHSTEALRDAILSNPWNLPVSVHESFCKTAACELSLWLQEEASQHLHRDLLMNFLRITNALPGMVYRGAFNLQTQTTGLGSHSTPEPTTSTTFHHNNGVQHHSPPPVHIKQQYATHSQQLGY